MPALHPTQTLKALGVALAGYVLWVFADALMKSAGEAGLPFYEVVGFLGLFSCGFLIVKTGLQGDVSKLLPKDLRAQCYRGALSVAVNVMNTIALKHLPLAYFFITVFTAPLMIGLLGHFFFKEKLSFGTMLALLAGFGGIFYAINPTQAMGYGDAIGYGAALASALAFAVITLLLRSADSHKESLDSLVFFASLCQAVFGFALTACHGVPVGFSLIAILMSMSFFAIAGNMANYWALRHATAAQVGSLHYTQLITGAIMGYLIWHDLPTRHMLTGALIIILSGIYAVTHAHKTAQAKVLPDLHL